MDTGILICLPKKDHPSPGDPNSTTGWCFQCGEEVWISEAMAKVVGESELRPMCWQCGSAAADTEDATAWSIHPAQKPFLDKVGLLEQTNMLVERLNRAARRQAKRRRRG